MARTVLTDGFKTLISFGGTAVEWKDIQPPGISAGGGTDTTTHANETWRTMAPKKLKSLTESGGTVAYDPAQIDTITTAVGTNQEFVITFPDDTTCTFWAWLDEFVPDALVEGEQPTASMKIIPSNTDADGDEIAPVWS